MLRELSSVGEDEELRADLCIVGAGAAGITLALAFADSRRSVLLLEAGGEGASDESQRFYAGTTSGDLKPYILEDFRKRQLGGSTSMWGGHCQPLDPIDFEERPWVPGSGWPISRADLDPYYEQAARFMEVVGTPGGPLPEAAAGQFDAEAVGAPFEPRFYRSAPVRFGKKYAPELRRSQSITTLLHAPVFELLRSPGGETILEAGVSRSRREKVKVRADAFVLATGGIENARLLHLNRIGQERDLVGRYFMSHPALQADVVPDRRLASTLQTCRRFHGSQGEEGIVKLCLSDEVQAREKLVNVHLLFRSPDDRSPDDVPSVLTQAIGMEPDLGTRVRLGAHTEQRPERENRVGLGEGTDPLGFPQVHVHWSPSEPDLEGARWTVERFGRRLGASGLGRLFWPKQQRDRWFLTRSHHLGATRMHADVRYGVVDSDCRVHGMENLYVTGASVFSSAAAANPTFTVVALALRLAEHLKSRLPAGEGR